MDSEAIQGSIRYLIRCMGSLAHIVELLFDQEQATFGASVSNWPEQMKWLRRTEFPLRRILEMDRNDGGWANVHKANLYVFDQRIRDLLALKRTTNGLDHIAILEQLQKIVEDWDREAGLETAPVTIGGSSVMATHWQPPQLNEQQLKCLYERSGLCEWAESIGNESNVLIEQFECKFGSPRITPINELIDASSRCCIHLHFCKALIPWTNTSAITRHCIYWHAVLMAPSLPTRVRSIGECRLHMIQKSAERYPLPFLYPAGQMLEA